MRGFALCVLAGCFGGNHELPPRGDAGGIIGDSSSGDAPAGDAPRCIPRTCAQPVLACGDPDDGCGGTLACGACPAALTCGAVAPNVCGLADADRACTNGWCWQSPLPFGNDLQGAWAASPTDAWAVGEGGTILRFDGAAWRPLDSGTSEYIDAVWGASASDVWLGGGLYARHWNGSALQPTSGPGATGGIRAIAGTSGSDVLAVGAGGSNGDLFHWNGSAWSGLGDPWGLDDVCAISPTLAYAVGFFNAYRWNGATWTLLGSADIPSSHGHCYGAAANDLWVSGDKLRHFDGAAWTTDPAWPAVDLLAGTGAHDVWASTDAGLVHWDGAAWSAPQPTDPIARIANGVAVGPAGRIYRLANGTWTQQTGFGPRYALGALCAFPDDSALAIGTGLVHYAHGVVEDLGASGIYDVAGAYCASPTDAWAVADFALQHYDGARWTAAPDAGAEPVAVWGASATDVWAVTGASDTFHNGPAYVLHYDGASWAIADSILITDNSFSLDLAGVAGSGPHDVWVIGEEQGVVAHFDGAAWTRLDIPGQPTLSAIAVAPDGTPFITGTGGVWTRRSGAWVQTGGGAANLTARAANDVWGSDAQGTVWRYDGAAWTQTRTGAGALLAPAFGAASAFLAGTTGGLLRRSL